DVIFCDGKVFDRVGESDQDITRSVNRVANLYNRKSSQFSERKIFPYVTEDHLRLDLIPLVKQLASVKRDNHPWTKMSPMELFRSSGLYEDNLETGQKGFNLAAILLFGRDEVIRSCLPAYCTDAIFRNTNQDRYDDRQIVSTNLIEAYDILMDFTRKHTDDRFFLEDGLSIGVRDIIAREVISNLLVHREYSSAFPAKLVIDKNNLYTENWNKALTFGKLDPETFTPYPKNPLIASFFLNINRADILGSGVRNLFKYTKVYSGGEPVLEEGDIFKTTIPLSRPLYAERRNPRKRTLDYLEINDGAKTSDLVDYLGYKSKTSVLRILSDLIEDGLVVSEGAGKNTGYSVKKR
ncbi:MAG: AAA family ATPase, partial [Spirochaetales bacterium]|nr:AAA family ATPase [Spirochaetales bacterium]